jgi:hypothetical protein
VIEIAGVGDGGMDGPVRQGQCDYGEPVVAGNEFGEPGDVDHRGLSSRAAAR